MQRRWAIGRWTVACGRSKSADERRQDFKVENERCQTDIENATGDDSCGLIPSWEKPGWQQPVINPDDLKRSDPNRQIIEIRDKISHQLGCIAEKPGEYDRPDYIDCKNGVINMLDLMRLHAVSNQARGGPDAVRPASAEVIDDRHLTGQHNHQAREKGDNPEDFGKNRNKSSVSNTIGGDNGLGDACLFRGDGRILHKLHG